MNKTFLVAFLLAALLVTGTAVYVYHERQQEVLPDPVPESAMPVAVESAAPAVAERLNFSLPDLDGNLRNISDWDGKARLVNFWATWCAPCRREIPLLKSTQDAHAGNNLQVIGVAVDYLEPVQTYAEETDFNYPILVGQEEAMAAAEQSGIEFIGLPFTLVVAPGGELLKSHTGEIHESQIKTILGVFAEMESGRMDVNAARLALTNL